MLKTDLISIIDEMIGKKDLSTFDYYWNGRRDGLQELKEIILSNK